MQAQLTEVVPKAQRRRFSASNKLRMLQSAEACAVRVEVGVLLCQDGLYSLAPLTKFQNLKPGDFVPFMQTRSSIILVTSNFL